MTDESKSTTGGCMCGAVRYEAIGEPFAVGYCHCRSCRHHTGAPVAALVAFERDRVKFTKADRSIYNSSPGVERGFCDQCGTPLSWEGKAWDGLLFINFHISTLDSPDNYVPDRHWYHSKRIAWVEVSDDLPR